jgi:xanthine dehydrogenase accessory factor
MYFSEDLIIIRGGGDLATGVAFRLHRAGFPLIVTELAQPLVVRRAVALASAVLDGEVTVEGMRAVCTESASEAERLAQEGVIPVLVQPELEPLLQALETEPTAVVDARMAKRNIDTHKEQAPLVVALGPGFTAGVDCDAIVETMRGHRLGRVIWEGAALPNTGTPGIVAGKGKERVLRAPVDGVARWQAEIGDLVQSNQVLGTVEGQEVRAPFEGVVRGLIASGTSVRQGLKIGDVDARGDVESCFLISDKALAIGGGVLEAVLTHLNRNAA